MSLQSERTDTREHVQPAPGESSMVLARAVAHALLPLTRRGSLRVIENGRERTFGSGSPVATVRVLSPRFWGALLRGSIGLADAYANGWFDSPDLVGLIRLAARNGETFDGVRKAVSPVRVPLQHARAWARPANQDQSRRDIAAHYDLGNGLFELMLDPTMMYSCALFEPAGITLEEAQIVKLDRICDKLELAPGDRLLEIGTGWGGLALHAARTRGCHVTTTTISREQYEHAVAAVKAAGLSGQVEVLMSDYRDLQGRFDKLVSIEMIEAVGWRHFGVFMAKCSSLLNPRGSMFLQAITIDDRAYKVERASRSFIKEYIFPGGSLPSVEVLTQAVARRTDMQVFWLQDITEHYVETLHQWRRAFLNATDELEALGYDLHFRRIWELYLAYCEAGFAERRIGDVQMLIGKPR